MNKISFSCSIKCNTSHFNEKIYISLGKRVFQCFSFISMFWMKIERKSKKYINISWQFIFFSQNCINYPVSSVSCRINILSKKDHLYFSWGKGIYAISRKKFLFTKKVNFLMIFCLFYCFHQTINKKTLNVATLYFSSEKNNKWRVFQHF